jgi:hypothetical protein
LGGGSASPPISGVFFNFTLTPLHSIHDTKNIFHTRFTHRKAEKFPLKRESFVLSDERWDEVLFPCWCCASSSSIHVCKATVKMFSFFRFIRIFRFLKDFSQLISSYFFSHTLTPVHALHTPPSNLHGNQES